VLDYQSQQHRLLPRLAESYAIVTTSNKYMALSQDATEAVDTGKSIDPNFLAMAHAMSCALKVVSSELCTRGIEICRRACGGHGYLQSSGLCLPEMGGYAAQFVTAEGENYVISQQTSRTLVKLVAGFRLGMPLSPDLELLSRLDAVMPMWTLASSEFEALFERRFLVLLKQFVATTERYPSLDQGIQANLIDSHHLTLCFGQYLLVRSFAAAVASLPRASPAAPIAQALLDLFCVTQLQADLGDFIALVGLPVSARAALHARLVDLLARVRPHAVSLVEAFDHSDITLNSTLGRADGRVYESLFQSSLLYASDAIPSFTEFLQPLRLMHAKL
ncbi:hypothetical protein As57867_007018, partial [Aphanomyces stellatus]